MSMLPLKKVERMQPKRAVLQTDAKGRLKSVPTLPPHATIEATFLVVEPSPGGDARKPPAELAAVQIVGDIMSPAIDEGDWGFMK
jgi:hypothetical protein